jgi:hypothetical protein
MKKLSSKYAQSALNLTSELLCSYWALGSRRLGFVRRSCLHQRLFTFPFHVIKGSELDAFPRHPKYSHVMCIKKLLEVTRSMMTGLDSKRIHRKDGTCHAESHNKHIHTEEGNLRPRLGFQASVFSYILRSCRILVYCKSGWTGST